MKKYSFKQRFRYWFDNQMAKGSGSMIRMLAEVTVIIAVVIALGIFFVCKDDVTLFESLWDSFATVINAWMPYSSDGSAGYLILTAIMALVGLLFTSVLIGIVSSFIEEKLNNLRKGTSTILEEEHFVVLGFEQGKYTLLTQLVKAAEDAPRCIVVAEAMEKDEMETCIRDNIEIPKNVRFICRNVDICDPVALECCAIPESRTVLVNITDDSRTVRTVLAVRKLLLSNKCERKVPIIGAVSNSKYLLPKQEMKRSNIILYKTANLVGRVIAHSATQIGLARAFTEVFNFEGSEFYVGTFPSLVGKTFREIAGSSENGVPVGIIRKDESLLVPDPNELFRDGDALLYFAESRNALSFAETREITRTNIRLHDESDGKVLILRNNGLLSLVRSELPKDITTLEVVENMDTADLETLVRETDHVILLSDASLENEEADMKNILTLLALRDIRLRTNANFNITVEMHNEKDRNLVMLNDTTDFIVASDITAMILAQLAENPQLYDVFRELLSSRGCEFCVKKVYTPEKAVKTMTVREVRHKLLSGGYVMLGFIDQEDGSTQISLNPSEDTVLNMDGSIHLIVIGKEFASIRQDETIH